MQHVKLISVKSRGSSQHYQKSKVMILLLACELWKQVEEASSLSTTLPIRIKGVSLIKQEFTNAVGLAIGRLPSLFSCGVFIWWFHNSLYSLWRSMRCNSQNNPRTPLQKGQLHLTDLTVGPTLMHPESDWSKKQPIHQTWQVLTQVLRDAGHLNTWDSQGFELVAMRNRNLTLAAVCNQNEDEKQDVFRNK